MANKIIRPNRETIGIDDYISSVDDASKRLVVGKGCLLAYVEDLDSISARLLSQNNLSKGEKEYFWESVVRLGVASVVSFNGSRLLEAYETVRVNKILNAEFGQDESPTTVVLRGIASSAIRRESLATLQGVEADAADDAVDLYDIRMGSVILGSIYGNHANQGSVHPSVVGMIRRSAACSNVSDPAMARLVGTIRYRSPGVLYGVRDEYLRALMESAAKSSSGTTIAIQQNIDLIAGLEFASSGKAACFVQSNAKNIGQKRTNMTHAMFPGRGESPEPAKKICKSCSLQDPCLELALQQNIKFGIWGGTSEKERRKIRRARLEAAALAATEISVSVASELTIAEAIETEPKPIITMYNT